MIARYCRPEMSRIWSEEGKLARWLEVELAALDGWAEVGAVPAEDVAAIRAQAATPTAERVQEIERTTDHDLAAFVDAVAEQLGPEGRWVHYGLTSSDVVDTALALQMRDAGELVLRGIERALAAVVRRAEEHRRTVCIGRSHGIHAEPTTFGWKLAGWAFELDRARSRVERALEQCRVGQLSGTVGTYAAIDPEVERIACERLGLEPDPVSTQVIARDRHAELLSALALCATSLDRFATEIRHLARTEVREVEEPFAAGMKGSSAMPHKRNPKVAERISGLARVVRAAAVVGFENVPLWHERDISHSSAERVVIPDAFFAVDYALDRFTWIVDGLVVHPERMERNLWASHGLFFSHRLLLALIESGLERAEAYRLVQRSAMQAWDEERDFPELVRNDPDITAHLDDAALADVFDLSATVSHLDAAFDRVRRLVPKEEPVHA
ncbi:MAG: adenylosuccinate lyase [Thermoleophilia bacterium]|nr:adenylosuccinate lyase [Thermoleophilia bacterium]